MTFIAKLFTLALAFSFTYSYGQYCTAVGPSQVTWSNVESASMTGESATFITYTGCPGVAGLEDLTGTQSVSLNANGSYTLNVQFGTCDNNFVSAGEAWIDFDGDQTFDVSESIGTWQGTPPVPMSMFSFTVPANCANGSVRLRLTHQESVTPPLNPCASYTWGSTIDFEVVLSGGAPQLCTSAGPTSSADSNLGLLDLNGESGTAINYIGCPGIIGLDDQTSSHSVTLASGNTYSMAVLFGTCGGNYGGAGEVWIDYNYNLTFEPSESLGSWQGLAPKDTTFTFTVPGGTADGFTRMRVTHQEGGVAPPLDPCATFTWGSTTDFEIIIGPGMDCTGFVGDSIQAPRIVSIIPFQEDHSNLMCYTNNVTVYNSPDIFYRLIPGQYGADYLNVSLCGSVIDTYLQIQNKDGQVLFSNDDYQYCSPQSEVSFPTAGIDTCYVIVQGWGIEKGDYSIAINDGATVGNKDISTSTINIYPNPSSGIVNIEISETAQLVLRDIEGRVILVKNVNGNQILDLSSFGTGVYLLEVNQLDKRSIYKIIIEP